MLQSNNLVIQKWHLLSGNVTGYSMWCVVPQIDKTAVHLFGMDAMRSSMRLWGNTVLLLECHFQVLDSNRRHWSCSNASSEYVPKNAQIQIRRVCCSLHTVRYFSFKKFLPQNELYEVWHYPALKEIIYLWLQLKVLHGISGSSSAYVRAVKMPFQIIDP